MEANDPEYIAWQYEQIGVEPSTLPLNHAQTQRFLALSRKKNLKYQPLKKRVSSMTITKPAESSAQAEAETALITQYDRELEQINQKKTKLAKLLKDLNTSSVQIAKKRAAIAKVLGVTK